MRREGMRNGLIGIAGVLAVLAAAGMAAVLSGATVAEAREGQKRLSASELRTLFPGRFEAVVKGYRVTFVAHRNGRLVGYYGALKDTGRWRVRGTRLCITLEDWLDGKMRCSAVQRGGGTWLKARGIRFRRL